MIGTVSLNWIRALSAQGSTWRAISVVLSNDDLLVLGFDQKIPDDDCKLYIYDTKTKKWSSAELHGPCPRNSKFYSSQTSEAKDRVYVFWTFEDTLRVSVLDFLSNMQWIELDCTGDIPSVTSGYSTTIVGSSIYLFGGETPTGELSKDIYSFNIENNKWKCVTNPSLDGDATPLSRTGHTSTLIDKERIFIFGGKRDDVFLQDGFIYNISTNIIEQVRFRGEIPESRALHTTTPLLGSNRTMLVVFGGYNQQSILNSVHTLDLITMSWLKVEIQGDKPTGRFSQFGGSLENQIIYFGGEDNQDIYFDIYFLNLTSVEFGENVEENENLKADVDVIWDENQQFASYSEKPHEPTPSLPLGKPTNLFVDTTRPGTNNSENSPENENITQQVEGRERRASISSLPVRAPLRQNMSGASIFTNKHIVTMLENTPTTPVDERKSDPFASPSRKNSLVSPNFSGRSRRNSIASQNRLSPSRRGSLSGSSVSPKPRSTTPINFYGDKTPPRSGTPTSVIEDDEEQAAQLQETFGDLSRLVAHKKILKLAKDENEENLDSGIELEFNVNFGEFNFGDFSPNRNSASLADFCKTEADTIHEVFKFLCNPFGTEEVADEESEEESEILLHLSVFLALCKHCNIFENGISIAVVMSLLQKILDEESKSLENDSMPLDLFRKLLLRLSVKKYGQHFESTIACFRQLVNKNILPYFKECFSESDPRQDQLFSGESVSLQREYDAKLKELFMLYATLRLSSAHQPSWSHIVTNHTTISIPELLQLAHNFDIVPYLIPRHIYVKIVQSVVPKGVKSNKSTENELNFPQFVEGLFRVALHIYSKYPYSSMMRSTREKLHTMLSSMGFDDRKMFNLFVKSSGISVRNKHKYKSSTKKKLNKLNDIIQDPDALQSELVHIFLYYCAFGDPLNLEHMSGAKFTKFVKDIQIDKFVNKEAADLIYVKLMKNRALRVGDVGQSHYRMTFPYFMEALKIISTRVYSKLNPKEALYELLKNNVFPFASKEPKKFEHVNFLEAKTQELFTKYKKQVMALFHSYCTRDTIGSHNFGFMTIDSFSKLAVQFDITPTLVPKKDLYRIFRSSLLNSTVEDIDYQQFEECLAKVAYLGYSKHPYDIKYKTLDQKVYAIFEKIGILDWVTLRKVLEKFGHKVPYSPNKSQRLSTSIFASQEENMEFYELPPEAELDYELRCIFSYYSEYGNRFGKQQLGSQQYNRFCKDSQLFDASFSQADGDLIYVEVTKSDQQKLTYELFCDSLTFLAERKYSDMTTIDALRKLLLYNVLPHAQRKRIKEIISHEQINTEIYQVVQLYEVPLLKIFDTYRKLEVVKGASAQKMIEDDNEMSLVEFLRFTQDFDICPVLLSVSEVTNLFKISLHQDNFEDEEAGLNFSQFLDCIARIAMHGYGKLHFNSMFASNRQKAEALMERMDLTSAIRLTNKLRGINVHSVLSEK